MWAEFKREYPETYKYCILARLEGVVIGVMFASVVFVALIVLKG